MAYTVGARPMKIEEIMVSIVHLCLLRLWNDVCCFRRDRCISLCNRCVFGGQCWSGMDTAESTMCPCPINASFMSTENRLLGLQDACRRLRRTPVRNGGILVSSESILAVGEGILVSSEGILTLSEGVLVLSEGILVLIEGMFMSRSQLLSRW